MTIPSSHSAFSQNFLGNSPLWYKKLIVAFLLINPIILYALGEKIGPMVTSWALVIEFIITLAMALKCYPLQPGGLLVIEAVALGLAKPENIYAEIEANLSVILLLMFMVAGIYFMKDLLLWIFGKVIVRVQNKTLLSFMFCFLGAILSAFLDALTVTAVVIAVCVGVFSIYHKVASGKKLEDPNAHDATSDRAVLETSREDLNKFRAFLRNLLMHAAIGTALGGVCTLVGEPQNLLIARVMGWDFVQFFQLMSPISMPVLVAGLITCVVLEKTKTFGYGAELPNKVRSILTIYDQTQTRKQTPRDRTRLVVQAIVGVFLIVCLLFHLAEIGLIGLTVIILVTSFNGITEEHRIGNAFSEAMPFTALLIVFFGIVAVIHQQHLFTPIINQVLAMEPSEQAPMFFLVNGVLSMVSDNVFVATIYISEVQKQFEMGLITREHFENLAIAINTGTNLPSVATPNGQAAFLFLLTSAIAPLVRLSYGRMVFMALPYTIVMTLVGLWAVHLAL